MHDISLNNIVRRYTPLSYSTVFKTFNFELIFCTLHTLGIEELLLEPITKPQRNRALAKTISLFGDGLTLSDYKEGGSFNYLTLDIGRYYIEHVAEFFDNNYLAALAMSKTQKDSSKLLNKAGLNEGSTVGTLINKVLSGHSLELILLSIRDEKKNKNMVAPEKVKSLFKVTLEQYKKHYKSIYVDYALIYGEGLKLLASELQLPDTQDVNELLLSLMHVNEGQDKLLSISTILNESSLTKDITAHKFKSACDLVRSKLANSIVEPVIDDYFYQNLGVRRSENLHEVQVFLRAVEAAGTTQFVALTAWRESEYGFSLKDIHVTRNRDLLDGVYNPLRFNLLWVVPKTNGETKLEREITLSAYGISD